MAAVVISSVQAGVGKTTLAAGLGAALRLHGYKVNRFAVGPGLPVYPPSAANPQLPVGPTGLDAALLSTDAMRAIFHSMSTTADISIIEGSLGIFDSHAGSEQGSTAQLAACLHVPVVLVIDAEAFNTPRSILALIRGYAADDGSCNIAGVVLNKAARPDLAAEAQAVLRSAGLHTAVLGALPMVAAAKPGIGETQQQQQQQQQCLLDQQEQFAQAVCHNIDLQSLRQLAATAAVPHPVAPLPPSPRSLRVSLGVACDEAFYSYFQQNLHMLQLAGVQLVPFSPLHDTALPAGCSGVLLGGGDVAKHAEQLAANSSMLDALRAFAQAGGLVVGEAEGLLYVSQSLQCQQQQQRHAMVGLLPFHVQVPPQPQKQAYKYVHITVKQHAQHPLLIPGSTMRGVTASYCQILNPRPAGDPSTAGGAVVDDDRCSDAGRHGNMEAAEATADCRGKASAGAQAQETSSYSYSYACAPLSQNTSPVVASEDASIDEGYTCGTALASAFQVHYGSCPEIVQHIAQRCLRVDVATVTAAAKQAAAASVCAAPSLPPTISSGAAHPAVMIGASAEVEAELSDGGCTAHDMLTLRLPSPRTWSAPDLQDAIWCQLQSSDAGAAEAPGMINSCPGQCSSMGGAWSQEPRVSVPVHTAAGPRHAPAATLTRAVKSCSVPGEMWQLAYSGLQQDPHNAHIHSCQIHLHQAQQLGFRMSSCPDGAQGYVQGRPAGLQQRQQQRCGPVSDSETLSTAHQGLGFRGASAFSVPKRWSMELQRLGSSLTSQLLQGTHKSEGNNPAASAHHQQQQQPQPQQRGHSRTNSRGMMHLPEEAPLSESVIHILDSSLPAQLGRTHHTHLGVAVPLNTSSPGASVSGSIAAGPYSSSGLLHTGGALDSASRSSSVHEQMSSIAATFGLLDSAAPVLGVAASVPAASSQVDSGFTSSRGSATGGADGRQQHERRHSAGSSHLGREHRLSQGASDVATHALVEQLASGSSQASVDTPTAFAAVSAAASILQPATPSAGLAEASLQHHVPGNALQQWEQPAHEAQGQEPGGLQQELSLRAGLGAGADKASEAGSAQTEALPAYAPEAASVPGVLRKGTHSSTASLSGLWAAGTPKAAAAAAAAAASRQGLSEDAQVKVLSLSPAATDILIALGMSRRVVGVTDACQVTLHSSSSSNDSSSGCRQVLQLLESLAVPWVTEAVEAATSAGRNAPEVVCRLVDGADGSCRYKLDEDCIRQLQPTLVIVACDENSGEVPQLQHYQQLKGKQWAPGTPSNEPAASQSGSTRTPAHGSSSAANAAVAVPGRVRLEPRVVQRVLQRAGVWGEGRSVVLYQRCHSFAEVFEFTMILAQAAGVPERGALLVEGLRRRLRTAVVQWVSYSSEACNSASSMSSSVSAGVTADNHNNSSSSSRSVSRWGSSAGSTATGGAVALSSGRQQLSVVVLSCTDPLTVAGFWVSEMLELLGLNTPALSPAPAGLPSEITWAQLRSAGPDVLVLSLAGLSASQATTHLTDLAALPGFWALPAVRAGAVYAVDHALLMRPGPGLVLGQEVLSHLAMPNVLPLPVGLPRGSVQKLTLHAGQRCRPRLVPHYMATYC